MADADDLKALKDTIAADAPQLAKLLDGSNFDVAVGALGKTLLGDAEAPLADVVAEAKKGDKLRIAAAEQEAQLRLRQSGGTSLADLTALLQAQTAQEKAGYQDTEDARQMQIKTHDSTTKWLAYIVTAAFFALIAILMLFPLKDPDPGVKDLLFTLLGVVATGWASIVGFYFGSSAGSAQKSQAIQAMLQRKDQDRSAGSGR